MTSFREKETPEERYKRLEHKYGKELHEAMSKKDQLRKEKKVTSWMEAFVLLNEQEPKPVSPPKAFKTPNGIVEPLLAAGIVKDPNEELMKRAASKTSAPPLPPRKKEAKEVTISKEDRERVDKWFVDEIASEQKKLDELATSTSTSTAVEEQKKKVENLQRQVEDLRAFERAAQGKTVRIDFSSESIFDQRVKRETLVAGMVALFSFLLMFLIMNFLD